MLFRLQNLRTLNMKKLVSILFMALFILNCGGVFRTPAPVTPYQYGDEDKSCKALQHELEACKEEHEQLKERRNGKIAANAALGITGAILFFPLLFAMDISDVDVIEIKAQEKRYTSLSKISIDKNCDIEITPLEIINIETKSDSAKNKNSEKNVR